jgi:hypothetical protein
MAALSKPKARRMGWWSANASPSGLEHNGTAETLRSLTPGDN